MTNTKIYKARAQCVGVQHLDQYQSMMLFRLMTGQHKGTILPVRIETFRTNYKWLELKEAWLANPEVQQNKNFKKWTLDIRYRLSEAYEEPEAVEFLSCWN